MAHVAGEQKSAEAEVAGFATSEDAKGQTVFLQGPSVMTLIRPHA